MNAGNLFDLAPYLAHDAGAGLGACATSACKVQATARVISRPPSGTRRTLSGQQLPLDDPAGVLFPVLLEACQSVLELPLALFYGLVMVSLVLLPHLVPFAWVLRLVGSGAKFHGKVLLDQLEPYFSRSAVKLGGVKLDAAQLLGAIDPEEDVPYVLVWQEVADAVYVAYILDAGL